MSGADPNAIPEVAQSDIDAALAAGASSPNAEKIAAEPVSSGASKTKDAVVQDDLAAVVATAEAPAPVTAQSAAAEYSFDSTPADEVLDLPDFTTSSEVRPDSTIDLLSDVELNVKIELGRAEMLIEDVLRIGEGSVVELDKLAGDPVDVLVNDRLVARGEILVLNDNFCVRISEIIPHGAEAVSA
jgi:flagellar motor switch protein FliN/FliY